MDGSTTARSWRGGSGSPAHAIPDAALVLEAYRRFGEAILAELVGEFALAFYSTATRRLCLARSTCGARPLFYVEQPDRLLWASDFAHLVRITNVALTLDEIYLLEYLVAQPRPDHTPLRAIAAVPANCALRFVDGRLRAQHPVFAELSGPPMTHWGRLAVR